MRYIVCFLSAFIAVSLETGGMDLLAATHPVAGHVVYCAECNRHYLIGLCGLFFLWSFLRTYYIERASQKHIVPPEDLALLKIIESNAKMICHEYRPHKDVVNIEEWSIKD